MAVTWPISRRKRLERLGLLSLVVILAGASGAPAAADVGKRDHQFTAPSVVKPSGQKPQSKLWFNDGLWWGSLFRPGPDEYRIHRLDPATDSWVDTTTVLDDRNSSEGDVLSTGSKLYVASASDLSTSTELRLYRYSYDSVTRTYAPDPGFPIQIGTNEGPVEAIVLDRDTSGHLWVTYTKNQTVFVSHTQSSDTDFVPPYELPVAGANTLKADDISAIVSFDDKIGVMWSNQTDSKMYFAEHMDGAGDTVWSLSVAYSEGLGSADDHINLKSLSADPAGRVFAAVKTSFEDQPGSPGTAAQVNLLVLPFAGGSWTSHTFGTVADDHTRPIVLTDQVRRKLYVLATSPTVETDGVQTIYYKSTSLDMPNFAPGLGLPLMQSDSGLDINDATSTKQDLGFAPGLVALASDPTNYWHNSPLDLGPAPAPPPPPPAPGPTSGGTTSTTTQPGGSSQTTPPDTTAPNIVRLLLRPASFLAARRGGSIALRANTNGAVRMSEAATMRFRVTRRVPGRRIAGRCQAGARLGGPLCRAPVLLRGAFGFTGRLGVNRFRFTGRLRNRALPPGRYVLTVTAVDAAGNRSAPRSARFRIFG